MYTEDGTVRRVGFHELEFSRHTSVYCKNTCYGLCHQAVTSVNAFCGCLGKDVSRTRLLLIQIPLREK